MLIRNTRRDIARVNTVLAERLRADGAQGRHAVSAKHRDREQRAATDKASRGRKTRKRKLIGDRDQRQDGQDPRGAGRAASARTCKYGKYLTSAHEVQGARREERVQDRRSRRDRREPPAVARQALAGRSSSSNARRRP